MTVASHGWRGWRLHGQPSDSAGTVHLDAHRLHRQAPLLRRRTSQNWFDVGASPLVLVCECKVRVLVAEYMVSVEQGTSS